MKSYISELAKGEGRHLQRCRFIIILFVNIDIMKKAYFYLGHELSVGNIIRFMQLGKVGYVGLVERMVRFIQKFVLVR
jgi:hypothetical protein